MKKILLIKTIVISLFLLSFLACSDDDPITVAVQMPEASYTYEIFESKVVFTNTSQHAVSNYWTFGDGQTSTEQNPTHTYEKSGSYEAVLTITDKDGKTRSYDETIKIVGDEPEDPDPEEVEITLDGNFDDWAAIKPTDMVTATLADDATENTRLKEIKLCANKDYIFLYVKMDKEFANAMDIYLNTDGKKDTGYNSWMWADLGANYLMQSTFESGYDMRLAAYDETKGGAWGWVQPNIVEPGNGLMEISNIVTVSGTIVEFEARIARAMIPNLKKEVSIGIGHSGVDGDAWTTSGRLPGPKPTGEADSPLLLKMP